MRETIEDKNEGEVALEPVGSVKKNFDFKLFFASCFVCFLFAIVVKLPGVTSG